jgi:cbb3-type cytochrome c oxidase subunit III
MSFRLVMAVVALLGAGSLSAQAPADKPAEPAAAAPAEASAAAAHGSAVKPGDAKAGQAKAATCAACHGLDGNPASSQYPKLAGQHENYIVRQVGLFKSHKRENAVMMGFVMSLSEQDMHDIGAYFAGKSSLAGVADEKMLSRGQALYRGGDSQLGVPACMACHGPDGRGMAGAGYPQLAGQWADYVQAKLKDWKNGTTWGDDGNAKIMPQIAQRLGDADIAALASYVEGLHTAAASGAAASAP